MSYNKMIEELNLGFKPRILIGVSCGEKIYTIFATQLNKIKSIYGDVIEDILLDFAKPVNVSRNSIMSQFLVKFPYATHLLILDDDVIVPEDFIVSLLRAQKESKCLISAGLLSKKSPPFFPLMNRKVNAQSYTTIVEWKGRYISADTVGFGCVLIHRRVLQDVPFPFCVSDIQSEDYYFFEKCTLYGYRLVVDTELVCGHLGTYVYTISDFEKYKDVIKGIGTRREEGEKSL